MNQGLGLGLFAAGLSAAPLLAAAVELTPNARLHVDHAWHEADTRALDDALIIRRAQFGLDGKVNEAWSFEVTYDFAKVGAFKDVFLQYKGWKSAAIKLGQFKVPFGLGTDQFQQHHVHRAGTTRRRLRIVPARRHRF